MSEPRTPAAMWRAMLKHYRERAGFSQERLAAEINFSPAHVASVETGRRNPGSDFAKHSDNALNAGGALIALHEIAFGEAGLLPSVQELSEAEDKATMIRGFDTAVVPGLLQTAEYARTVLELDGEEAVAARLARQAILDKENPPVVRYVIDEWALRRPVGNADVMRRQLEHLEDMVTSGRVRLQVLPSGALPGIYGTFVLATVDGRTVGYVEATVLGWPVTDREDLHRLESIYDLLLAEALNSSDSLGLIRRVKEEAWTT